MTSVEKHRSNQKSGRRRKHGHATRGGSFQDENDREVSNLTDRAFRSLCIGDEAVYNDSDLGLPSPNVQRDRQLAFFQSDPERDIADRERDELKQAAHENFSRQVQQYRQDWSHGGMYGAEIHRDPQWDVYREKAQGRVSATFQHTCMETFQQGQSLNDRELSFFSNGSTELSSQQCRSRSRVSSLIRAFNSDGQSDEAGMDDKLRDWNDETNWDKSALISIQRELSDFSTPYQQYDSNTFPSVGPFFSGDANYFPPDAAMMAHVSPNSASYMRSPYGQHCMNQVNCGSNFFIHSEFSPFKVWRQHSKFPFQQGDISGFMHCSEFPKWYEEPMYKELSIDNQQSYFGSAKYPRNNRAPVATQTSTRSTSTSSVFQKSYAVEKRCESELSGHFPHRKRAQSFGNHRLPTQRPSTASPTVEMSRRIRDTISSVKALQEKIKMMTEQNIQPGAFYGDDYSVHSAYNALMVEPNVLSSNSSMTPFSINHLLAPLVHSNQEVSAFQQYDVSPQPVEHAPVRAESRGATPDVRMSSYKSRATSLLFNLKDNRKRVKSTYSPTKFKGIDTVDQSKQSVVPEMKDIFQDSEMQFLQHEDGQESRRTDATVNQFYNTGQSLTAHNSVSAHFNTGQYPEITPTDYQGVKMQDHTVHHSGFTGFLPENYTSNCLTNGQNPHEYLASFTPYEQGVIENISTLEGIKQPYAALKAVKQNSITNQSAECVPNTGQALNESLGSPFLNGKGPELLRVNKQDYNGSLQENWQHANNKDDEKLGMTALVSPLKQETTTSKENPANQNKKLPEVDLGENLSFGAYSHDMVDLNHKNVSKLTQEQQIQNNNNQKDDNNEHRRKHVLHPTTDVTPKTDNIKQYMPGFSQEIEAETQTGNTIQAKDKELSNVREEQLMASQRKAQHAHADAVKAQQRIQTDEPTAQPAGFILAKQCAVEIIQMEKSKSDLSRMKSERQAEDEHIDRVNWKKEATQRFGEETEQVTEKHAQKSTDKIINIREKELEKKSLVFDCAKEESRQVKAEQKERDKLLEEAMKTDLEKPKQSVRDRITQHKNEQTTDEKINKKIFEKQSQAEESEGTQMEEEQIKPEIVNVEQIREELEKENQREEITSTQSKAEGTKTKEVEEMVVKIADFKIEDRPSKSENASVATLGRSDLPEAETFKARDITHEDRRAKESGKILNTTKIEKNKAELFKSENLQERSVKLTAATQQVRCEPDKVEQVKTELAKAKAELAKIKEKMKEQKEKPKIILLPKEADASNERVNLQMILDKNKKQDFAMQIQANRGAEDYNKLREKYGLTGAPSIGNTKALTSESGQIKDANETEVLETDENEEQLTDKLITENKSINAKEDLGIFKDNVSENPNNERVKKCEVLKDDVAQQEDLDLAQTYPERDSKLTVPSVDPGKDLRVSPPKSVSHKERAKQELLTSKIKAHAEKEISAIKEKGFALRDGFIGKSSTKPFAGQNFHIRQKPPSEELSNKRESTVSDDLMPKSHNLQLDTPKTISSPNPETAPVKSTTNRTGQLEETRKADQVVGSTMGAIEESLEQKYSVQNNEQTLGDNQRKQQKHGEIPVKLHKETNTNEKSASKVKNIEDLSQDSQDKVENPKLSNKEKTGSKEADFKISETMDVNVGEREDSDGENLQIMGILVTVRERKPSVNMDEGNSNTSQMLSMDSGQSKVNMCVINTDLSSPKEEKKQDKVIQNNPPENAEETAFTEKTKNASPIMPKKKPSGHQESCTANLKSETIIKDVPSTITGLDEYKVLDGTQPDFYKKITETQEKTNKTEEETLPKSTKEGNKSEEKTQELKRKNITETVTPKLTDKVAHNNESHRMEQIVNGKEDAQGSKNVFDQTAHLTEEKSHDIASLESSDKAHHLTILAEKGNQSVLSPPQCGEIETKKSCPHENDDVHIDCIAIRVVPAVKENIQKIVVKTHSPDSSSDTDIVKSHKSDIVHTCEDEKSLLNKKDCSKELTPANREQNFKENDGATLIQSNIVPSETRSNEKMCSQQKNKNVSKIEFDEKMAESREEPMDEDYFQVQGTTETHNEFQNNTTIIKNDNTHKESKVWETIQNKTTVISESSKDRKEEPFAFTVDPWENKGDKSSLAKSQDENIKNPLTAEAPKLDSKVPDCSPERLTKNVEHESRMRTDWHGSRNQYPTKAKTIEDKFEVKAKTKERVSTVPEISAIADYARLKVIVSDDKDVNPVQEFPPNKKEGFFPLIQPSHSRRPVFPADPQEFAVKEKSLPNKFSAKVNKQPKALVFPIIEKEHQKTGMFKLGDKEKQQKMSLGDNEKEGVSDIMAENLNFGNSEVTTTLKREEPRTGMDGINQSQEKVAKLQNMPDRFNYFVQNSSSNSTLEQMHSRNENTTHRRDDKTEMNEKEQTEQKMRVRQAIKESRTSSTEEEQKAIQREEERRISEKQQNQRQRKVGGERTKQVEEERRVQKSEEKQQEQNNYQRTSRGEIQKQFVQKEQQRRVVVEQTRISKEQKINTLNGQQISGEQIASEKNQKAAEERERTAAVELKKRAVEERERRAAEEREKRAAEERKQRALAERERRALEEQEEQYRRAAVEQKRRIIEERERRAGEERQRRAVEEQERKAAEEREKSAAEERQRRAAEERQRRAAEEQERKAAEELERRAADERQRRAADERQRRAAEERQRRAAEEQEKRASIERQRRAAEEQERRAAEEREKRPAEERQRRAAAERQRRAAEEQERKAAEELGRRATEERERRAAEERQRRAMEEQERRAAEERQRRAMEEQERRAAEERQRRAAEEQERRAAEELERRAADERQRRAAEERQRRAAEEQEKRASVERQRRAAEEQERRAAEERERRAAEDRERRAAEEQERRTAEERQRRAAEEQERRAAEERERRAAEDRERRAAEEQERRAAEQRVRRAAEERHRRAAEERERRATEEQESRAAQTDKQRQSRKIKSPDIVEENERESREQVKLAFGRDMMFWENINIPKKHEEGNKRTHTPHIQRKWAINQNGDEENSKVAKKETNNEGGEKKESINGRSLAMEDKQRPQEILDNRDIEMKINMAKDRISDAHRENPNTAKKKNQTGEVPQMDGLQYYAMNLVDQERKQKERYQSSPLPSHNKKSPLELESTDDSAYHPRPYGPPASPAPSFPRSNTSSPALGAKPSMFRVKDNTARGSSLTKPVRPRFHKNFGEDFRVGSPFDKFLDREDDQEIMRRSDGTPVQSDGVFNRFGAVNEALVTLSKSSSLDNLISISHHRPYSRRSLVIDEDESRSVVSNMSEDMESFATSAADLADIRGLLDSDRPESACSFSSDASRSMGKPPTVPPKSEKAMRRAQRLTSRRIKKELSKAVAESSNRVEKEVLNDLSSTEVCSSKHHAVASPHFSLPVSLTHAPKPGSNPSSSCAEHQSSSQNPFHATPHATGPISLPIAVPHPTSSTSLPAVSPPAYGLGSQPKKVAHVPSSPTLPYPNPPTPVTQYHVESSRYPQTQRKVLQDLGSGQYFVVDMPVQVKTKTFFDPETGKYVQLNVRKSGQSVSRPQSQQTISQVKQQSQPFTETSPSGKSLIFQQDYLGCSQNYQPAINNAPHPDQSSDHTTFHQDPSPPTAIEREQGSSGNLNSLERTPYMDTVNSLKKSHNSECRTQESYPCETNGQETESSVFENITAQSQCLPRDIIAMSELEDFMEVSDW